MSTSIRLATLPHAASRKFNPYSWLINQEMSKHGVELHDLTHEAMATQRFDVLHVHWFEGYTYFRNPFKIILRTQKLLAGIDRQRKMGAKLIYSAHDVIGHDTRWRGLEERFFRAFMKRVDGTIYLSEVSRPLVEQRFPELKAPHAVIAHPTYDHWYPDQVSKSQARKHFGIEDHETVIAHVGLIKRYKNVPTLLRAFKEVTGDFRLLIGGRILEDDLREEIEALAAADPRVILQLKHLDDDQIQYFFRAADGVVLPYKSILNSGSAMLALTFAQPVVVPNTGSMPELQRLMGPDWVQLYDGEFDAAALQKGVQWMQSVQDRSPRGLSEVSVERVADQHLAFYRQILGSK